MRLFKRVYTRKTLGKTWFSAFLRVFRSETHSPCCLRFDTEEDELVSLTELHTVPVFNIADAKGPTGSRKLLRKLVIVGA